ncbi:hypothetical protein SAMN04489844_1336 [Nocardioides exalbidus]|uniref:Lipoprotein n=1 Tax=Nocardioides exalbidus TaxID=402596 RepID=A0A1H4NB73_9ACTN|nr:hypothetical protein [Nocardioides exalbidus]SEB92511.1 hypothetical protein SAMN04489844_1336 [Nocardioides exalbidus]
MALRRPALAGALALTALLSSGCGGVDASTAPTTASEVDFCMTWVKQATDIASLITEKVQVQEIPTGEEFVTLIDAWSAEMLAVGTPGDMPDGARSSFETYLEYEYDADELDFGEFENLRNVEDPGDGMDDLSTEEFNQARELSTYLQSTCNPLWRERGLL